MYEGSAGLMSKVCCYWLLPLWCLSSHKTNKTCLYSSVTRITAGTGKVQVFIVTICKWMSAMLYS